MEENKSYIIGVFGALIGGLVASIPWILMYVYGKMILSLLAIIIAMGALKGYQILKGKMDEKLPTIITVVSVISVTVATLVIIPLLLLAKEGINPSLGNLKILYQYDSFSQAIIKDYIVSLIFTFLGISGVVSNIRRQIYEGNTEDIKVRFTSSTNQQHKEIIKGVFTDKNALDKYSAITKEEIFEELDDSELKLLFNRLKQQQIIRKYKGKYYYSLKNEKSIIRRFLLLYLKIILIIILFSLFFGFIFCFV